MRKPLIILVVLVIFLSCNNSPKQNKSSQEPLARVGDNYLYPDDLTNLGLVNVTPEDSAQIVKAYIDSWIRNETFVQYASKNLDPIQIQDIDQKVANYRQSLLSYNYETQIIQSEVDTIVTNDEINAYYQSHQKDFVVNEPIYRFIGFKRDQSVANTFHIKKLITDFLSDNNDAQLREYCTYNTIYCHLNIDQWVTEKQFLEDFQVSQDENFTFYSSTGSLNTVETGKYYYIYQIIEKIDSGFYPIDFVRNDIIQIIIREREKVLVDQIHQEIFSKAMKKNEIEIY